MEYLILKLHTRNKQIWKKITQFNFHNPKAKKKIKKTVFKKVLEPAKSSNKRFLILIFLSPAGRLLIYVPIL